MKEHSGRQSRCSAAGVSGPYAPTQRKNRQTTATVKPDEELLADILHSLSIKSSEASRHGHLLSEANSLADDLGQLSLDKNDIETRKRWLSAAVDTSCTINDNGNAEVTLNNVQSDVALPSYVLQVSDQGSNEVAYAAVHHSILHSQLSSFAKLPILPPFGYWSYVDPHPQRRGTLLLHRIVPTIQFSVPHLQSLFLLLSFCYIRSPEDFFNLLTGFNCDDIAEPFAMRAVAKAIAGGYQTCTIEDNLDLIKGLVKNGKALGVDHQAFWDTVETAQKVYLDALLLQLSES